uniref:Stomatin n=1 Tax=Ornithorhynchus anatinus TaxID=9258 RepID=K7EEN5_ORNAN
MAESKTRRVPDTFSESPSTGLGPCGWILVVVSFFFTVITFPFSVWMCIKIIKEYERAIIFRLGRILQGGAKGPGLFFILPCTDSFIKVDMRTISFDIPPQEILTKDSVTVSVDGVVYYRVQNATLAVANITNADSATRLLAQTTLRNVLGTKNLSQILSDREEIAHNMQATLDDATDDWGIKVERVEIKDVKLPVQLQRAMAAEAEAAREARAKVIIPTLQQTKVLFQVSPMKQTSREWEKGMIKEEKSKGSCSSISLPLSFMPLESQAVIKGQSLVRDLIILPVGAQQTLS